MIFDYNILISPMRNGRRFGKTYMIMEIYLRTLYYSAHLGDLYFKHMTKKHRQMLNTAFSNYISKEVEKRS